VNSVFKRFQDSILKGNDSMTRGKGEGTIYKRPDGRWEARVVVGRTPRGNPKRRSVYGKTRKEVADKLHDLRGDQRAGRLPENVSTLTVGEFLEVWLQHRSDVAITTLATYRNMMNAYVIPALGERKLTGLTPLELEGFQTDLAARGLSARIVEYAHVLFKAALKQAVRWRLLPNNPMDAVNRPPGSRPKRRFWTPEQARTFLNAIQKDRLHGLYLLVILTGLRRGELLGLRWDDIDWSRSSITVQHSLVFANGKRIEKDSVKTPAGKRSFTVPKEVLETLRERRTAYELEREVAGERWQEKGFVFGSLIGTGLYESTLREQHDRLIVAAGVPRITMHELRHTYTSLALLRGVDLKEVSRRLGHSTVRITLDTYQHLYPEQDQAAALSSEELLGGKAEEKPDEISSAVKLPSKRKKRPKKKDSEV
jgi:integrase